MLRLPIKKVVAHRFEPQPKRKMDDSQSGSHSPLPKEKLPLSSQVFTLYLFSSSGITFRATLEGIDVLRSYLGALLHVKAVIRWVQMSKFSNYLIGFLIPMPIHRW